MAEMPKVTVEVDGYMQNIYTQIIGYLVSTCYNGEASLDITEVSNVKGCMVWIENNQLKIRSF